MTSSSLSYPRVVTFTTLDDDDGYGDDVVSSSSDAANETIGVGVETEGIRLNIAEHGELKSKLKNPGEIVIRAKKVKLLLRFPFHIAIERIISAPVMNLIDERTGGFTRHDLAHLIYKLYRGIYAREKLDCDVMDEPVTYNQHPGTYRSASNGRYQIQYHDLSELRLLYLIKHHPTGPWHVCIHPD